MAGHSHAKNIMHRKGKSDAVRSKVFSKLAREITVAAKLGVPDPAFNSRLRRVDRFARPFLRRSATQKPKPGLWGYLAGTSHCPCRVLNFLSSDTRLDHALSSGDQSNPSWLKRAFCKGVCCHGRCRTFPTQVASDGFFGHRAGTLQWPCASLNSESCSKLRFQAVSNGFQSSPTLSNRMRLPFGSEA